MAEGMFSCKSCCSCLPQRWILSILGCLGMCIGNMYQVVLSMTIVEMVSEQSPEYKVDGTCEDTNDIILKNNTPINFRNESDSSRIVYDWDQYTQGIILSSYFWTCCFSQFFCGCLAERFGGKYVFGSAILIPAVIIFFTPMIISWGGSTALIASRALMGIPNSAMFPASSTLISRWTTSAERDKVGNVIYTGQLPGLFFGTVIPALIMKYSGMGWPAVFYFFGTIGVIWFVAWGNLVYDSPEKHPFITDEELAYLRTDRNTDHRENMPGPPWKHILTCKEFWAFTICTSGSNWPYYAVTSDLPKYMSGVVKFSLESNGYFSSVPYLFMWATAFLSTWIMDTAVKKQWASMTNVKKLFTTISVTGPSVFLVLASYAECDKVLVATMFLIGVTLMGCLYPSLMMNCLDLSPNYAGSLMSLGNGLAASIGIVVPYVVGLLTPNQTIHEWRLVFWIVFIFSLIPNVIYIMWFKAEVQDWNDLGSMHAEKRTKKNAAEIDNRQSFHLMS